jgi:hypothetical protein
LPFRIRIIAQDKLLFIMRGNVAPAIEAHRERSRVLQPIFASAAAGFARGGAVNAAYAAGVAAP